MEVRTYNHKGSTMKYREVHKFIHSSDKKSVMICAICVTINLLKPIFPSFDLIGKDKKPFWEKVTDLLFEGSIFI